MRNWRLEIILMAIWLVSIACFTTWLSYQKMTMAKKKLISDGRYVHHLISQRVGQHDAHLTGISALASSSKEPPQNLLLNLTEAIRQFYPRIESIDIIALQKGTPSVIFSTRSNKTTLIQPIRDMALKTTDIFQILPTQKGYILIKKSSHSNKVPYVLVIEINTNKLAESERELNEYTSIKLETKEHHNVLAINVMQKKAKVNHFIQPLVFQKTLSSRSQPLLLTLERQISIKDIIPLSGVMVFATTVAIFLVFVRIFILQQRKTKLAEHRALLGEHEARIAQASRINGLGEMASSIAHEINQPLTAILGQSQAGRRLLEKQPNYDKSVATVLQTIAQQAKRAGDILSRLKNWSCHEMNPAQATNLNAVVEGIAALIGSDLKEKGISLRLDLGIPAAEVFCDPVQIEQVLFNLVRNSIEAMENVVDKQLSISAQCCDKMGVLKVVDTGKGISPESLPRLTEPFFSTKQDGMGLGLSLCERIISRFGGSLEISNRPQGGACSAVVLPLASAKKQEAQ